MTPLLTRQGVRNLNAPGASNPPRRRGPCRHFYAGPLVVVGYRQVNYDWYDDMESDPIYARLCVHCRKPGPVY